MTQELIVVKSVEISASPSQVWIALTEPDKIKQWMAEARVESRWEPGSDITFITFSLDRMGDKTRLTMRQENFHSEVEYKHANFFWGTALYRMKNLLEH